MAGNSAEIFKYVRESVSSGPMADIMPATQRFGHGDAQWVSRTSRNIDLFEAAAVIANRRRRRGSAFSAANQELIDPSSGITTKLRPSLK